MLRIRAGLAVRRIPRKPQFRGPNRSRLSHPRLITAFDKREMKPDRTTSRWHKTIISDAEERLGRKLTDIETRFITSRGGYVALEMIHDTIRAGTKDEIGAYLNSEAGEMPRRSS